MRCWRRSVTMVGGPAVAAVSVARVNRHAARSYLTMVPSHGYIRTTARCGRRSARTSGRQNRGCALTYRGFRQYASARAWRWWLVATWFAGRCRSPALDRIRRMRCIAVRHTGFPAALPRLGTTIGGGDVVAAAGQRPRRGTGKRLVGPRRSGVDLPRRRRSVAGQQDAEWTRRSRRDRHRPHGRNLARAVSGRGPSWSRGTATNSATTPGRTPTLRASAGLHCARRSNAAGTDSQR